MLQEESQVLCLPPTARAGETSPILVLCINLWAASGYRDSQSFSVKCLGAHEGSRRIHICCFHCRHFFPPAVQYSPSLKLNRFPWSPRAHRSITISFLNTVQSPRCYGPQFKHFPSLQGKTLQNALMYLPTYVSYCFFGEHTEPAIKSLYTSQARQIQYLKTVK